MLLIERDRAEPALKQVAGLARAGVDEAGVEPAPQRQGQFLAFLGSLAEYTRHPDRCPRELIRRSDHRHFCAPYKATPHRIEGGVARRRAADGPRP